MKILITGGAGFVGGALARFFLREGGHEVTLFDNLRRRGSEWNLSSLIKAGARFVHGDVRLPADLSELPGSFDVMIEASAEPSVHAGIGHSPRYVIDTNLHGAINCLEFAREHCGGVVFLSSSRVYPIASLRSLPLVRADARLELDSAALLPGGVTFAGISESFGGEGPRSYYGASKYAAEGLCLEYSAHERLPVVVNRCGVIAGPGQFGRTDQGVYTLWVARHFFGRSLTYTGFGGQGHQVRDLLHVEDFCELVHRQVTRLEQLSGRVFNVGGGRKGSVSLAEYTRMCREVTGRSVPVGMEAETNSVDIPWYITDHGRVSDVSGWIPTRQPQDIVADVRGWISDNEQALSALVS